MIIHVTSVSGFILMLGKSLKYHRPEGQQLFYPRGEYMQNGRLLYLSVGSTRATSRSKTGASEGTYCPL